MIITRRFLAHAVCMILVRAWGFVRKSHENLSHLWQRVFRTIFVYDAFSFVTRDQGQIWK